MLLLLLRRGEPLVRGAVTFFSGKKESNQRKLPREREVAERYNGPSLHCVPLSASPRRSNRICYSRMLEIWDIGAPTASRPAGCRRTEPRRCAGFAPDLSAVVGRMLRMPEREAVGERASRFACNGDVRAITTSRVGREGNAVERSPDRAFSSSPH